HEILVGGDKRVLTILPSVPAKKPKCSPPEGKFWAIPHWPSHPFVVTPTGFSFGKFSRSGRFYFCRAYCLRRVLRRFAEQNGYVAVLLRKTSQYAFHLEYPGQDNLDR